MVDPDTIITVKLTACEVDTLHTSCISMHSRLQKDGYVPAEELDFWYRMGDKLMTAKIRQTPQG